MFEQVVRARNHPRVQKVCICRHALSRFVVSSFMAMFWSPYSARPHSFSSFDNFAFS